jgi:hypothetical protein
MVDKYPIKKAIKDLYKIENIDLDENFVAIGSYINDERFCYHSIIIICYIKVLKYFHYSGKSVELIDADFNCKIYINKLNIIHEDEVVAFLGFCEELCEIGVHPEYGFIFNDSFYKPCDKSSFLKNAKYDITTCSGFCIKVIRGFLYNNPEYVYLKDWTFESYEKAPESLKRYMKVTLEKYAIENDLTLDDLFTLEEIKRITPLELLIAPFYNILPIRKESIDFLLKEISDYISRAA